MAHMGERRSACMALVQKPKGRIFSGMLGLLKGKYRVNFK
jgi:hypothetical protein